MRTFICWLVVCLPLGWGVYNSILKSLPLFGAPTPAAAMVTPVKPVTDTGNSAGAPTPTTSTPAATPMQTAAPVSTPAATAAPTVEMATPAPATSASPSPTP